MGDKNSTEKNNSRKSGGKANDCFDWRGVDGMRQKDAEIDVFLQKKPKKLFCFVV